MNKCLNIFSLFAKVQNPFSKIYRAKKESFNLVGDKLAVAVNLQTFTYNVERNRRQEGEQR